MRLERVIPRTGTLFIFSYLRAVGVDLAHPASQKMTNVQNGKRALMHAREVRKITAPIRRALQNRNMTARILAFPKPMAFPASAQNDSFGVDERAFAVKELPSKGVAKMAPESIGAGLRCMRGTLHLLMLEGLTVAVVYGVWQLAKLMR